MLRYIAETSIYAMPSGGGLIAYGIPDHTAVDPKWISARAWQDLNRDRAHRDRVFAEGVVFYHIHVVCPFEVQTLRAVARLLSGDVAKKQCLNGLARRPSPKSLAIEEMKHRAAGGRLEPILKAEVDAILEWLAKEHPDHLAGSVTARSLQNVLRGTYASLKVQKIKIKIACIFYAAFLCRRCAASLRSSTSA